MCIVHYYHGNSWSDTLHFILACHWDYSHCLFCSACWQLLNTCDSSTSWENCHQKNLVKHLLYTIAPIVYVCDTKDLCVTYTQSLLITYLVLKAEILLTFSQKTAIRSILIVFHDFSLLELKLKRLMNIYWTGTLQVLFKTERPFWTALSGQVWYQSLWIQRPAAMFLLSIQQVNISILSCNTRSLWRLHLPCAAVSTFLDRLYELKSYRGPSPGAACTHHV